MSKFNLGGTKSIEKTITAAITAPSIEEMEATEPNNLIPAPYALETIFNYEVLPPSKPKDAKKADIYNQFDVAASNIKTKFIRFKNELNDLEKKAEQSPGIQQSIKDAKKEIEDDEKKDVKELHLGDLQDFIEKWNIDEKGYWISKLIDLRVRVRKQNFDLEKEKKIATINNDIKNINKEIENFNSIIQENTKKKDDLENEIADLNEKLAKVSNTESTSSEVKKDNHEVQELTNNLKEKKRELNTIKNDLESDINKNKNQNTQLKNKTDMLQTEKQKTFTTPSIDDLMKDVRKNFSPAIKKPDFILPEVGELFENKQSFFLEITDTKELSKANELKQRYTGKEYKVVAKV